MMKFFFNPGIAVILALLAAKTAAPAVVTTGSTPFNYGVNGKCGPNATATGFLNWRVDQPNDKGTATFRWGYTVSIRDDRGLKIGGGSLTGPILSASWIASDALLPCSYGFDLAVTCADGSQDFVACIAQVDAVGHMIVQECH